MGDKLNMNRFRIFLIIVMIIFILEAYILRNILGRFLSEVYILWILFTALIIGVDIDDGGK